MGLGVEMKGCLEEEKDRALSADPSLASNGQASPTRGPAERRIFLLLLVWVWVETRQSGGHRWKFDGSLQGCRDPQKEQLLGWSLG